MLLVHTLLIAQNHHVKRLAKPLSGTTACKPSFCDMMNRPQFLCNYTGNQNVTVVLSCLIAQTARFRAMLALNNLSAVQQHYSHLGQLATRIYFQDVNPVDSTNKEL
jgi:hypothetical protein